MKNIDFIINEQKDVLQMLKVCTSSAVAIKTLSRQYNEDGSIKMPFVGFIATHEDQLKTNNFPFSFKIAELNLPIRKKYILTITKNSK